MLTRMPFVRLSTIPIVFIGRPLRQPFLVQVKMTDVSRGCGGFRLPGFAPVKGPTRTSTSRRTSILPWAFSSCRAAVTLMRLPRTNWRIFRGLDTAEDHQPLISLEQWH
jgi:hypothetical protein